MNKPSLGAKILKSGKGSGEAALWDLPTRLFHWLLVTLVALLYVSGEFGGFDLQFSIFAKNVYMGNMDVHGLMGQMVLALVLFRLLWGVWGSSSTAFRQFLAKPARVFVEIRCLLRGQVPDADGHNPLGGWMVAALLLLLLAQTTTGLFAQDDLFFEGPLAYLLETETSERLTGFHHRIFSLLYLCIGAHILAILYYWLRGRNLVKAMITGKKSGVISQPVTFKSSWLALFFLIIAIGFVALLPFLPFWEP